MQAKIHNEDVARIFEKMSRVLSLKENNRVRILAYENASRSMRELDEELAAIAAQGKLEEISGIGKDLAEKIEEALRTGHVRECKREFGRIDSRPQLLLGTEVDILPDGKLDYPDDVLAKFDVVIAAIHGNFKLSRKQITERVLRAIDNCYVNVIAHPTGRLIGKREPIEFDFDRVVSAAKQAGVALELDGSTWRPDLNDILARSAAEAGALLSIAADARSTAQLSYLRFGVLQARRAWIGPASIVDTWSWSHLHKWLFVRRSQKVRGRWRQRADRGLNG